MIRSALQKSGGFASKAMTKPNGSIGSVRFMAKEIKFGVEGRASMLRGVDILADAVQVSAGKTFYLCLGLSIFFVEDVDIHDMMVYAWLMVLTSFFVLL
jgi:hypothetical protein